MSESVRLPFPLSGHRVRLEVPDDSGTSRIVRLADGSAVGTLSLESHGETPTIRSLCIDSAERSYGCGSEAGWLTVNAADAAGYSRLRAASAPELGLSVYYWIRMGLHPLHGPGPDGGIWFERIPGQEAAFA
jgi:hypothetical protein